MDPVWHEVIGLVGDVRAQGLDRQVRPEFYLPWSQMPTSGWDWIGRTMDLVVRTQGPTFPANDLRRAVASIAPGVPIYQLSTMQHRIASTLEESHFRHISAGAVCLHRAFAIRGRNLWRVVASIRAAHARYRSSHGSGCNASADRAAR